MSLSIGIVGLPNVGKSTVFNALVEEQQAQVANYPFCTIQPNRAIVPLVDPRLDKLAELVNVERVIYATIEFVDIAGLVRGASQGEGLGNQFLAQIRDVDALVHVVRCFDDPNVVHVSGELEARADAEVVNLELALADLEQIERRIEKLSSQVKGDKQLIPVLETAQSLREHLQQGQPVASFPDQESDPFQTLVQELRFLTGKPMIYAANVDETGLAQDGDCVVQVRALAAEQGAEMVKLSAKFEEEMAGMSDDERREFLQLAGAEHSGLEQVVRRSFETLDLINFFTHNEQEARAWNIPRGWKAPRAAGVIHTDFERGFIRAEVLPFKTFVEYGSEAAARAAGALRSEGKEYVVQDGDVILFRFNV